MTINQRTKRKNRLSRMVNFLKMEGLDNFTSSEIPNSILLLWNIERTALNGTLLKMERASLLKASSDKPRIYTIIK